MTVSKADLTSNELGPLPVHFRPCIATTCWAYSATAVNYIPRWHPGFNAIWIPNWPETRMNLLCRVGRYSCGAAAKRSMLGAAGPYRACSDLAHVAPIKGISQTAT
jgi:hypothetical protein